jgi:hypothetical protein
MNVGLTSYPMTQCLISIQTSNILVDRNNRAVIGRNLVEQSPQQSSKLNTVELFRVLNSKIFFFTDNVRVFMSLSFSTPTDIQ